MFGALGDFKEPHCKIWNWRTSQKNLSVTFNSQGSDRARERLYARLQLLSTFYVPHEDYKINTTFIGSQQTETTACDSFALQGHGYLILY